MSEANERPRAHPFFLPVEPGARFCLVHEPVGDAAATQGLVFVHAFAEEMNKSRRMAAMQARHFARHGLKVLQIDLYGCGDSNGDFSEARVEHWQRDITAAVEWLHAQAVESVWLWGLRFGALLAVHASRELEAGMVTGLCLWQPVISGATHLTQFLRIGVAAELLGSANGSGGSQAPRKQLAAGSALEIAGYTITPQLAEAMDRLRLDDPPPQGVAVDWFEVGQGGVGASLSVASQRVAGNWREQGVPVTCHAVSGVPFWATVEITDCEELLTRTTDVAARQWLANSKRTR